jgi:antitoxin component of MazEF toxin-antitoxin module
MSVLQQLRRNGNSYVVTVPKELVERNGWQEGQLLAVDLTEVEVRPKMSAELAKSFERVQRIARPAMRYLADR